MSLKRKFFKWFKTQLVDAVNSESSVSMQSPGSGLDETFLFDFKNYQSGYRNSDNTIFLGDMIVENSTEINKSKTLAKIKVKPIDVLDELEKIPTPFSLSNIDEKIEMLKLKEKHIVQSYSKREVLAIMQRLENRKKYSEFKPFFEQFQYTNDEKIDQLLGKYDLLMKTSDLFVPEFPDVAIKTMEAYTENVLRLSNKKPVYYVIATSENFKKVYEKRDPILLAQCPFSFNWQILGAWDKEMLLLYEL